MHKLFDILTSKCYLLQLDEIAFVSRKLQSFEVECQKRLAFSAAVLGTKQKSVTFIMNGKKEEEVVIWQILDLFQMIKMYNFSSSPP